MSNVVDAIGSGSTPGRHSRGMKLLRHYEGATGANAVPVGIPGLEHEGDSDGISALECGVDIGMGGGGAAGLYDSSLVDQLEADLERRLEVVYLDDDNVPRAAATGQRPRPD
ncbi:uncharacterized protein Z519_06766 [Cladophialophora bantiana CBS 173.52]|uniref:Uncharacterized protein n=1 Tax=Cladophialophora bantiana (strain ATCC 10958 / CBS 173.52 / CDC B-1940 / NIH 8579) TaxID=1442370 RepID=A0A0D2G2H5_CLAB1|nr:uncharacterized protein Z519_06766 [Cladophialophora bantiana CBS 173.52]KIW92917.1 hypothetical protein Z519_06766 [Cladophialophora bantiana CBS 173.52]